MPDLSTRIRHGVLWLFAGTTGTRLLGFGFGVILARLLAPEDFGMLITMQVFTGLASFVAGGGMGQALIRNRDIDKTDQDVVFTLQLLLGAIIYAGFFLAAPAFAAWYDNPLYADLLRVAALSFLFRPIANLPNSLLNRQMRYKMVSLAGVAGLLTSSLASIGFAIAGYGVWSLVLGGLVSMVVQPMILIPASGWRPGFSLDLTRGRKLAGYGMWVSVNNVVVHIRTQLAAFLLSRTLGPAAVGLFNKGDSLSDLPNRMFAGPTYQVLLRAIASEQDNADRCRYLFLRAITLLAVYGTPVFVLLQWIAEPAVVLIYGEKWAEAAIPLAILALAWPFRMLDQLSGAVLGALNQLKREFHAQLASVAVTGLALLIGLEHGLAGVAFALVGAASFSATYMAWLALRCLKARARQLALAFVPGLVLNLLLGLLLAAADAWLTPTLAAAGHGNLTYVLGMSLIAGLGYVTLFLCIPISALAGEQARIRALATRRPRFALPR